ncbi:unnamed protein product [Ranitomeya imitator]|uniref:Chromo domain-containing protein n=1 Tax=Ranitomeya imitator TaxID=111125 RepID=A0ABN9KR31_9NEOB|nr:unnamed protein product [Ranitomeya imitator]
MDPVKVQAIHDWIQPTSVKSLQKFLGFANFYRRFIANFSSVVKPLTDLTKKGADVTNWSSAAVSAFQELKRRFTSAPVLRQLDVSLPFQVEVDASEIGAGAVLSQRYSDGFLMKPCAFFSRKFSPAERNYDVGNRELLAMKWAFEEWRHWLEGAKHRIVVLTDHKNLIYLESAKRLNPRQARWSLFFSRFDFVVSYLQGSKNHVVRLHGIPENIVSDRGQVEPSDCPGVDSVVDRLQQIWAHVVLSQEEAQRFANRRRSLLRKYVVPVVPSVDPPAPVLIDGELEYVVEKILDSRFSRRKLQYLVKWKGYGQEDNSWVVASDVHAGDLFCYLIILHDYSVSSGLFKGNCFRINHFPEDNDYDHDSSEYLLLHAYIQLSVPCRLVPALTAGRKVKVKTQHSGESHSGDSPLWLCSAFTLRPAVSAEADGKGQTAECIVRASSVFPILSTILLLLGGLCVGAGRLYNRRNNIILSAGILFVAAGLSNIIGIIVYISSNAGDPSDKKDEDKKNHYNYGWSFYFGALSFIVAETIGVLAVNIYIERNKEIRFRSRREFMKSSSSPYARIPSYRYRRRPSRSSSRSTEASPSREVSSAAIKYASTIPMGDISMHTLSREPLKITTFASFHPDQDISFMQVHNCFQKELKEGIHISLVNSRTTPV